MRSRVKRGNRIVSIHLLYEFYKNLTLVNFLDLEGMLEEMVREVTSHHMEHILFARIEHKVFLCLLNPFNIVFWDSQQSTLSDFPKRRSSVHYPYYRP